MARDEKFYIGANVQIASVRTVRLIVRVRS